MPNLGLKVSRVYPPWGGGVPAGLRELSGFWGRIKGIKEIMAELRELTVCDLAAIKRCRRRNHVVSRGLETAFLMYLWVANQKFTPAALPPSRFSRDFEIYCLNCPKSGGGGAKSPVWRHQIQTKWVNFNLLQLFCF